MSNNTISILRKKSYKTPKEEAIDMARDSICSDCKGSLTGQICPDEDTCNSFQGEVKEILKEFKEEKE